MGSPVSAPLAAVPALSGHTETVLAGLGVTGDENIHLRGAGTIGTGPRQCRR
jgi:hypothetical protein